MLKKLLIDLLIIGAVAYFSTLISVDSISSLAIATLVLAIANVTIKPLLKLFTLPLNLITLGLFGFIINGLVLLLVSWLVPGFTVTGFISAIIAAIIISLAGTVANWFID